ncbi:MAG: hypothetical protein IKE29_09710 [Paenibacillus sp.]|uniref:hypothetical protein n=1 Tax=Paenibacillus sp. TaxID=58172 RepID=UPI0025FE54C3|nr:hypothetical protein [Paenibacillus sp.]MBR2564888.1 hypothetical protein [Paenibacillus sp.]
MERLGDSVENLEQIIQTALVLGIGSRCVRKTDWSVLQQHYDPELRRIASLEPAKKDSLPESTTLQQAPLLVLALHLRGMFRVLSAAEFPFDRYNYMFGILPSGTDANGHTPSHDHNSSSSSASGSSDGGGGD